MSTIAAATYYHDQIKTLTHQLDAAKKRHAVLGWLRLASIAIPLLLIYLYWPINSLLLAVIAIAVISIFLWLVAKALATEKKIQNINRLLQINHDELRVLDGHYTQQPDGNEFLSIFELADNDLDLFGKASLFQYINRSVSEHGKFALASALVHHTDRNTTLQKQEAVKELSKLPAWRQQLQAHGMIAPITKQTETLVDAWIKDEKENYKKPIWLILSRAVPVISFTILFLYLFDLIPDAAFNTLMILMLAFVFSFYKKIGKQYNELSKISPQLNAFQPLLACIEDARFTSGWLQNQQAPLLEGTKKASEEIAALQRILKRFEYRLNPLVYLPLSVFLFWDLQQALALEKWKQQQTGHIAKWFEALGQMEMMSSLGTLAFNQQQWTFPGITEQWFYLNCVQIGHPLIKENKLVTNDMTMSGTASIALVTGSNMAGKSTFLRTIGANMVLAMMGAPVRAKAMTLPVLGTLCSMRITDNLEEETSTFYAELKKIKRIVQAVEAGEKVFVLIDEMLRGTNTFDRHTGSVALIKQLIRHNAVGIIASHDTSLADLEKTYPEQLRNYHFDSSIVDGEIVFDYRLKDGVCTSTNASLLMKKIGIELE